MSGHSGCYKPGEFCPWGVKHMEKMLVRWDGKPNGKVADFFNTSSCYRRPSQGSEPVFRNMTDEEALVFVPELRDNCDLIIEHRRKFLKSQHPVQASCYDSGVCAFEGWSSTDKTTRRFYERFLGPFDPHMTADKAGELRENWKIIPEAQAMSKQGWLDAQQAYLKKHKI